MSGCNHRPPLLGRFLLRLYPLGRRRPEIAADMLEAFRHRVAERGVRYAAYRYLHDVLSLWVHRPRRFIVASRQRSTGLDGVVLDVRFAGRVFRRQPGIASITVTGLALAIGISAAGLGMLEALGLRPFGGPYSGSVVRAERVYPSGAFAHRWWHEDYERLRAGARLVHFESFIREEVPYGHAGAERLPVGQVSGDFFSTFGIRPVLGRMLSSDDKTAYRAQEAGRRARQRGRRLAPAARGNDRRLAALRRQRHRAGGVGPEITAARPTRLMSIVTEGVVHSPRT